MDAKTHWSCAELAALGLPGLPTTERAWRDMVTREAWPSRRRAGRGGGLEYQPPARVAALISVITIERRCDDGRSIGRADVAGVPDIGFRVPAVVRSSDWGEANFRAEGACLGGSGPAIPGRTASVSSGNNPSGNGLSAAHGSTRVVEYGAKQHDAHRKWSGGGQLLARRSGGNGVPARNPVVGALTQRQNEVDSAIRCIINFVEETQAPIESTLNWLNQNHLAGTLPDTLEWAFTNCHDKPRAGQKLNKRTYYHWIEKLRQSGTAAPRKKEKDLSVPPWAPAFLAAWQQPQKPTVQAAYRQAFGVEPLGSAQGGIPSIHQVRRFLEKIGAVSLQAGRLLPRELKTIRPFVRRTTDHLWPGDCYTADGHTFDAEVAHPRHGRPFRPEITTVLDVATRKCVGWSVNLAESTWAVLDAQRHAVQTHGIPALWYVDNGSGYKNAYQADDVIGFAARLGIEITHSLPYNSQARGLEERSHRTILVQAAKKLPTYMGAAMDREARQRVHKITRADIRTAGRSRMLLDFQEFLAFLAAEIDAYNARPHRALAKIVDPATGNKRHQSPTEAWEAARAEGWEPTQLLAGEADDLFRPYTTAKVLRGEIRLFNNLYFSAALEEFHGETVRVGYDVHDASRVWVRDHHDGRLICVAEFEANHRAYFPQSVIDQAAQKRAAAREKRLQAHLDEVHDELHGRAPALEHRADDILPDVFTQARLRQEAQAIETQAIETQAAQVHPLETADRRPYFDTDPEKYRWLIAHADQWDADDAAWLLEYAHSEDYDWMRERYEAFNQGWNGELSRRAEEIARHNEAAAR